MDEHLCYRWLMEARWPDCKKPPCPKCAISERVHVHDCVMYPVEDWRCAACGAVYNVFTGTIFSGMHRLCSQIIVILRGFAQGQSTAMIARELECDYETLLKLRHRYNAAAAEECFGKPAFGAKSTVEVDEMYQNAGEKGVPHREPGDPPRRRANKMRGHGTYKTDRPAVFGALERQTGEVHCQVVGDSSAEWLLYAALEEAPQGAAVMSDEWGTYNGLAKRGRSHATVNHGEGEYARDDDEDGVREVHCNSMEGFWTGLRNWLRTFRGVSKKYLFGYVGAYEWSFNLKQLCPRKLWSLVSHVLPMEALTFEPG